MLVYLEPFGNAILMWKLEVKKKKKPWQGTLFFKTLVRLCFWSTNLDSQNYRFPPGASPIQDWFDSITLISALKYLLFQNCNEWFFFYDQSLIKYMSCSYHESVRIDCQALYLIFGSFIFDLNFLPSYFAEVFHCPSPKWRPFSSSYPSCYVVLPVTLFIVTTSEQRSPIIHLKRCVLLSFVLFFKLAILI